VTGLDPAGHHRRDRTLGAVGWRTGNLTHARSCPSTQAPALGVEQPDRFPESTTHAESAHNVNDALELVAREGAVEPDRVARGSLNSTISMAPPMRIVRESSGAQPGARRFELKMSSASSHEPSD
jgi:hypothetical protein